MTFRRFDPPALHAAVDAERERRGMIWEELGSEIGVPMHVLHRLRSYRRFTIGEIIAITQWLNRPLLEFTRLGPPPEQMRESNT